MPSSSTPTAAATLPSVFKHSAATPPAAATLLPVRRRTTRPTVLLHSTTTLLATTTRRPLFHNTSGYQNIATGEDALSNNNIGHNNTATGFQALQNNTTGSSNTAHGLDALLGNMTGNDNTATGLSALANNTASENTATGLQALFHNTIGNQNTANGKNALFSNANGTENTANGYQALFSNNAGSGNAANGAYALYYNTTGGGNVADGFLALHNNSTGNSNVAMGYSAGFKATGSNNVYIGAGMQGVAGESNACYIASIFNRPLSNGTVVFVNADGKLGTTNSSRRFKDDIKPMDDASDAILTLKPVTFHYKKEFDPKGIPQFGLVAEDVEKINPDLVIRDKEGKLSTVRYEAINAMLLNEFLKEHRKVEEQEETIAELKSTAGKQGVINAELRSTIAHEQEAIAAVTTQLKEQAAQIQKVSAEVEVSKTTPQMTVNNPQRPRRTQ